MMRSAGVTLSRRISSASGPDVNLLVCRCSSALRISPAETKQGRYMQMRCISSTPVVADTKTEEAVAEMPNSKLTPAAMLESGAYAGLCVYGLSMGSITMTQYFMSLNMSTMAVYGFSAGLATGVGTAGILWQFTQLFDIRAEDVFQKALRKLQASTRVNKTICKGPPGPLGAYNSKITSPGKGRAYNISYGTLELRSPTIENWSPVSFVYPRVQMIFQVQGTHYDGMAVVEGRKAWGRTELELVALDVLKKGEEQVILVLGEEQRLDDGSTDGLRGFLDYKEQHLHE